MAPVRNAEKARQKVAFNQTLMCTCKGCTEDRYRMYPYCFTHTRRSVLYGSPDGRVPSHDELMTLDGLIIKWIENNYTTQADKRLFKLQWANAQKALSQPRSYAKHYGFFTGQMKLKRNDKAKYFLAGYQHRKGLSFSPALIRWMSVRLFAELFFEMPRGKKNFTKERRAYYNLIAGKYVFSKSGYTKKVVTQEVVGWEKSIFAPSFGQALKMIPIKETKTKWKTVDLVKSSATVKVVGWYLEQAISETIGTAFLSDYELLQAAQDALGVQHK